MALTFEFSRPVDVTLTGVGLWLMPALVGDVRSADPVEIARAPDSGGSPGTWETIARLEPLPSQGRSFVDPRPWTTSLWWYRYRHVRADGAVASTWSTATQHSVKLIPRANENAAEQKVTMGYRATPFGEDGKYALKASDTTGKETDDDLFVADDKTVKVGTVASPSAITKTLRFPFAELLPEASTTTWIADGAAMNPLTVNVQQNFYGSLPLPKGVTITAFRARHFRGTTNDTAIARLVRITNEVRFTLATLTHNSTGFITQSGSAFSQLVGDQEYTLEVSLKGVAQISNARFVWAEVDYTMPSYDKGY